MTVAGVAAGDAGKRLDRRQGGEAAELARLREENDRLRAAYEEACGYIRAKIDELLNVIGTKSLRPEELDEHSLIALDPIGIVNDSFRHILENLRETNQRLSVAHREIHAIFDTVGSALLVVDPQRRIVSRNRRADEILLRHDGDVTGRHCYEVLCDADPVPEECVFLQVMSSGREAVIHGKHLGERYFDVIAGPIFDDAGQVTHVVMSYHDVTEARQLERMKSEFVSTAAHELRTPLATIIGYTDLMVNHPEQTRDNLYEYLGLIQNRAEHLAHIVSDLLDVSRIEAGEGVKLIFQRCPLDLICKEVVMALERTPIKHRIEIDVPPGGVAVQGDRFALAQVIENLLGNAIKYSPAGGIIRIALRSDGGICDLEIADEGIGMTAEQVSHIFEKFYRADSSNAAIPGTGLGMTIVKYLVDAHHGQVEVDSTLGVGTTVRVRLPVVQPGSAGPGRP